MPTAMLRPTASARPQRSPPPRAAEMKFTSNPLQAIADTGVFEGYASLFDRTDLGDDVVAPGAFRNSLKQRGVTGIRMLYQHDPAQPIGVWERIYEDARGLFVRGRLTLDVAKAREVRALMKVGAIDGLSIGFKTLKGARNRATGLRRLTDVDLWEISIVTFPMLPEARITSIKQRDMSQRSNVGGRAGPRQFEHWLVREAGFTAAEARAFVRDGYHGLKSLDPAAATHPDTPAWQRRLLAQMAEATALLRQSSPRRLTTKQAAFEAARLPRN
jgi:uncharacterized protein